MSGSPPSRIWQAAGAAAALWLAGCSSPQPVASRSLPAPEVLPTPSFRTPALPDSFDLLSAAPSVAQPAPSDNESDVQAGLGALKDSYYKKAEDLFTRALAANPSNIEAFRDRARARAGLGENEAMDADYAAALALAKGPQRVAILGEEANMHRIQGRFAAGLAEANEAVSLKPDDAMLLVLRGSLSEAAGDRVKAVADFGAAIEMEPDSPYAYGARASCLLDDDRPDEALADAAQAVVLAPSDPAGYELRSRVLEKLERYQASVADLETVLRLKPDDAEALNNLAWVLATCPGKAFRDGRRAVELATRACQLTDWKDAGHLDTLAAAYAQSGDLGKARQWQEKAIGLMKDPAQMDEVRRRLELYKEGKSYSEEDRDAKAVAWESLRYETFQTVWRTVNDTYFDPNFGGIDWAAVREKYRAELAKVEDREQLRALLWRMVGELRRTHFSVIPREGAVFNPSERVRVGTCGADITTLGAVPVVAAVAKGSPAEAGGLRPGDIVVSVDGTAVAPVAAHLSKAGFSEARTGAYLAGYVDSFLTAAVGKKVKLSVEGIDGTGRELTVTCGPSGAEWSEPIGYFPSIPIRTEMHCDPDGVAIIKFNAFVPQVMRQVRAFMKTLGPGTALVIDLRGNAGGITFMAGGICGLLNEKEASIGSMHARDGVYDLPVYPVEKPFRGPVAVLIDARSISTSEILAAGIRDIGRARIFGEKSPGMALPSVYKSLPTGDLFQYAVADFATPRGSSIEGTGVDPDVTVAATRQDFASGRDPVLDAAKQWARGEIAGKEGGAHAP